ncbi:hypothetical protein CANARDRAFT_29477 [[Candida] arabinofermentans NRRL YB-2248]|uniref:AB hydrolase-1 domain-containing protein n=1 Tax=[Candida] arabinofermentans NRRL YB-2248 TaxID=983967 RepID=A0A1E4SX12_9ASCO|nr:hypothetical protein CANARDRAFT_29477 [[Candida] arabinofermentans NRRL YB-2248]
MTIENKTTNNGRINYTVIDGPKTGKQYTIVFVHGLGSSQNYYFSTALKLSEKNKCIILDNYGAGLSGKPTSYEDCTIKTMANDVMNVIDECGSSNDAIVLVGHSMGGMIVNYLTSLNKLNVVKSVLLAPVHPSMEISNAFTDRIGILQKSHNMGMLFDVIPFKATGSACSDFKKSFIRQLISCSTVEGYIWNCQVICNAGLASDEWLDLYSKIDIPVLIVHGVEDMTASFESCIKVINQGIRSSTIHKMDGVGHWPCIEDDEGVYNAIISFL